jgi:SAM-dependent methyltransferase
VTEERERLTGVYDKLLSGDRPDRWSRDNPGNDAIIRERTRLASELVASLLPSGPLKILDLGSGGNTTLCPELDERQEVDDVRIGLDILFERLVGATDGPATGLVCGDGQRLPFPAESFDVVALFTVFSSILDDGVRANIAKEVERVLRPGGFVLWYDMRLTNPTSRNLRGLSRRAIRSNFPGLNFTARTLTVLPPLARRLSARHYPHLARVPALRGHVLAVLTKPGGGRNPR